MSTDDGVPGTQLEFAWDPDKAASNLAKHGVTFAAACAVLERKGPFLVGAELGRLV